MTKFILTIMVLMLLFMVLDQTKITIIENCKVLDLQQQQIISGDDGNINTKIRYLIITDKETFISESSLMNGKFNNSDIFYNLKKDSTYTFEVSGFGKSIITDYKNILNYN